MLIVTVFFGGVNMQGKGSTLVDHKKTWEALQNKDEKKKYVKLNLQQRGSIPGLGDITFRLNPDSYCYLDNVVINAEDYLGDMGIIYEGSEEENRINECKKHINSLENKSVDTILGENIAKFKELVGNFMQQQNNKDEAEFLKELIGKDPPVIYFGATNIEEASGYYRYREDAIYVDIDPKIRSIRLKTYDEKTDDKKFIGTLVHESIHHYDYINRNMVKVLSLLIPSFANSETTDKIVTEFCTKIDSITIIMGSIGPGKMNVYAKKRKDQIDKIRNELARNNAFWDQSSYKNAVFHFARFIGEVIPNIYSAIALKQSNDGYKNEFITNLLATKSLKTPTIKERQEAFEFLKRFFEKYKETANMLTLNLPHSLLNAIGNVIGAYETVQKTEQEKKTWLHSIKEPKLQQPGTGPQQLKEQQQTKEGIGKVLSVYLEVQKVIQDKERKIQQNKQQQHLVVGRNTRKLNQKNQEENEEKKCCCITF